MSQLRVLIAGASVAGPATAYWLAKAGAKVTVIERFPKLRTSGQAVDIRTSGVTVMRKMPGMEPAVRAKTTQLEGISFVRGNGRPYGVIRATGNPDQQSLVSEYEIFRGDLAQILYNLTKDNKNIDYVFEEQVESIDQNEKADGSVKVEFTNRLPTSEYDLVVACDGATSRTRALGLGIGVRDYIEPTNCWATYFSIPGDLLNGSKIGQASSAPGGRAMALGPDPAGITRVLLMAFQPRHKNDATVPFREAAKQGDIALKQYIAEYYENFGWAGEKVIKDMITSNDFYANEIVQVKTPHLYKGRFVMVGDAGYAPGPTGAGTTLALTGAYLLAGEICKHKGDLAGGLEGYEEKIRPLITEFQKIPPLALTVFAPQTAWGIWLRNNIFALIAWSGIVERVQKFFASSFASTDKYKLPEYEWVR